MFFAPVVAVDARRAPCPSSSPGVYSCIPSHLLFLRDEAVRAAQGLFLRKTPAVGSVEERELETVLVYCSLVVYVKYLLLHDAFYC